MNVLADMSLLASALLGNGALLWTMDKRLEQVASELNKAYCVTLHS